jgi:hypothetical protein
MNRLVPHDRIKTLSLCIVCEAAIPNDFIRQQLIEQCANELVNKLFEHNKIITIKMGDRYSHSVSLDVIVPERKSS